MESPPTPARHVVHALPPEVQSLIQLQITRLEELRKQKGDQSRGQSHWDVLPDVLVGSDFIARTLTGTPTLMDGLNTVENSADFNQLRQRVEAISGSREEVSAALRRVRQEEIVRHPAQAARVTPAAASSLRLLRTVERLTEGVDEPRGENPRGRQG